MAGLGVAADRRVLARAIRTGLWTWPSFSALDAYMCFVAYPGAPFGLFVLYRIVIELLLFLLYRMNLRDSVDVRTVFRGLILVFAATSFTISLMAIHLGGIRSPYLHGGSLVALVWAALIPTQWRRGLPTFVLISLAFPLVMGIAAAVSPEAHAEWLNRDALIAFVGNYVFVLSSCTLGVILSHLVWQAQQEARKVGSYELEERLGQGGMGEVWRARHHLLARRSAIKLIRPEALGGDLRTRRMMLTRFEREAQATASLRSPHTVELYDFGVSDTGAFYYVMELLVGRDLESLVRDFGALPPERVLFLLEQMCESLGEAHAMGLVHRDVKPSNIYVCREGLTYDFVKVLDFGLAKQRRQETTMDSLQTMEQAPGTPAFMAPEVILGSSDIDRRVDIYALGCVAYYMLTGQRVFEADTPMKILVGHVKESPVPPSQRTEAAVPKALDELILACLEKDPARRPQDAEALLKMAQACRVTERWDRDRARGWWETHLPELCVQRDKHP